MGKRERRVFHCLIAVLHSFSLYHHSFVLLLVEKADLIEGVKVQPCFNIWITYSMQEIDIYYYIYLYCASIYISFSFL